MEPVNIFELEAIAREKLSREAYDYYAGGAHDEVTLRENRAAYDRISLAYRVLVDVSHRDLTTTVLGQPVSMPILVAPTAFHGLATPEGERAAARAAGAAGTIFILSTLSNTRVEDVVAAATGPVWFQLYVYRNRQATEGLVRRAEAAGCKALVLTVDAPLLGRRERDVRNRFRLPPGLAVANMLPEGYGDVPEVVGDSGLAAYVANLLNPALTWKDVAWLQSITKLPVLVKGIVRADDALRAAEAGAAGVVVSNHGGRQLDTSPATIEVLPEIADALAARGHQIELLLDGGIRRGTDVVKALALGANAVLAGRAILWGIAADGEAGAAHVLRLLRDELDLAMTLCGAPTVTEITRDLVRRRPAKTE
ncbi:MAG TPA: alpha-hydroxy acid oxidase [Thermoanaerobaculia bacterium]|jgi:4-hydroxymandelate oxidase|nr:alpha-hydroxy acid oxidase [Thermoanaerobaculia bacterium]